MDRCPNCDAAVRPNAKFCTSCGFRLPTPEPAKPSEPWRSPFATTSNYEHNQSWTAPVAPSPVPTPQPPQPAPEPVAAAPAEPAQAQDAAPVFAGWPNFSTSTIPAEPSAQAEPSSATVDHDEDAPAPSETREPASAAVEDAHAQELDEIARQYDERHGTNGKNQPFAWAAPLADAAAPEPAGQPEPANQLEPAVEPEPAPEHEQAAAEPAAQADTEAADEPTEPIPTLAAQPSGDAAQRALDLIDELRSLIPNLGSASGAGATDIRAILLEANVPASDSSDLEQLRAAIDTANNRPRDIDVMLDLVSRAAAIQAVIDERDRFAAAIGKALAATDHPDK